MKKLVTVLIIILATNGCYFSGSTWNTRLESVGWSNTNAPLFLERFPEGITIKGPKEAPLVELRPSEWKYIMHGPRSKEKQYTASFPGHLFYTQIKDESHVLLIGRTNRTSVSKLSIFEVDITDGKQSQLLDIDYSRTGPAEIRFSRDFSLAGLATESGVLVFEIKTGIVTKYLTEYRIQTIEFSNDSRLLAAYVQMPLTTSKDSEARTMMTTVSDAKGNMYLIGIAVVEVDTGRLFSMSPVERNCYESILDFAQLNYEAKNYLASPETSQPRLRLNFLPDRKVMLTGICTRDARIAEYGNLYSGAYSPDGSVYGFFRKGKKMFWIDSRTGKKAGEYELYGSGN